MLYVSGVYGLNINSSLNTCGDWHASALDWAKVLLLDSNKMPWGDWGIEINKKIPDNDGIYNVANHLRSILDLLYLGKIGFLKGFRNDFLCTDDYNEELFNKVYLLVNSNNWSAINNLMKREFMFEWDKFISRKGIL